MGSSNSAETRQTVESTIESAIKHHYDKCDKPTENKMNECKITFVTCRHHETTQKNKTAEANETLCGDITFSLDEFKAVSNFLAEFYDVKNKDPENLKFVANNKFYKSKYNLRL